MIKLYDLLLESIDIYSPEELADKGIGYEVKQDSPRRFSVNIKYKDFFYVLRILPILNPKRPSVNFGDTDENFENLNLSQLLNASHSFRILATIFGFVRFWVDKYNIKEFEYTSEGDVRDKIYKYYLNKHFSDFENHPEKYGEYVLQVWEKK